MFHLVSTLYSNLTSTVEYKVLVVGCDKAGKTTIMERLRQSFADGNTRGDSPLALAPLQRAGITSTVGLNITRLNAFGAHCLCWDLGGHVNLRSLWCSYYSQCQAIIFVVDGSDRGRFPEARAELYKIFTNPVLAYTPVLILINKCDMELQRHSSVLSTRNAQAACNNHNGVNQDESAGSGPVWATKAQVMEELGLMDLVADPMLYPSSTTATSCSTHDKKDSIRETTLATTTSNGGRQEQSKGDPGLDKTSAPFGLGGLNISADLRGTSGIGTRAFRVARISGLRPSSSSDANEQNYKAPHERKTEEVHVRDAFQWLVSFLLLNARDAEVL